MTPTSKPLSLLQISDLHIMKNPTGTMLGIQPELYFKKIILQAFANGPYDAVLVTGDLTQEACEESYLRLKNVFLDLHVPVFCLPGNHDNITLMQTLLNENDISCAAQHFLGDWQLISLNSQIIGDPAGNLPAEQLQTLHTCLAQNPETPTLVALHHHVLPTRSDWMDTMIVANNREFLELIASYSQVKIVINGHIHQQMDASFRGIPILSCPSTCFQFTPRSRNFGVDRTAPGYRKIQLYSDGQIQTQVERIPDELLELDLNQPGYLDL